MDLNYIIILNNYLVFMQSKNLVNFKKGIIIIEDIGFDFV